MVRQILCAFAPTLAFTSMEVSQLRSHLVKVRENGVTQEELIETNTHLAFLRRLAQRRNRDRRS